MGNIKNIRAFAMFSTMFWNIVNLNRLRCSYPEHRREYSDVPEHREHRACSGTSWNLAILIQGTEAKRMLGAILGEIIGEALVGWLFPRRRRPSQSPKEGMWNASLGSVAAFLGGLAVLFAMPPVLAVFCGR